MPDQEMIDKVAKVLWDKEQSEIYIKYGFSNSILFGEEFKGKSVPWEHLLSDNVIPMIVNEWREKAKAAIAAMREPTEAMLEPVTNADGFFKLSDPKQAYQTMIDVILK